MKLLHILPFLDDEDLTELINKVKNNEVKGVKYSHLYPFLSDKDVDELVDMLVKEGKVKEIYSALPFMTDKRLARLHTEVKENKLEGFKEQALLPFLGKDKIKELVDELIKNGLEGLDDDLSDNIQKATKNAFDDES